MPWENVEHACTFYIFSLLVVFGTLQLEADVQDSLKSFVWLLTELLGWFLHA
jgi:hypothetical protein